MLKFYAAKSNEFDPRLYEFDFIDYEELLDLDINEIFEGRFNRREEPLFLVCTNGAYDRCCGKYGAAVYAEIAGQENNYKTWQCTHLGGYRFAANVLFLPYGIYYGRVRKENVNDFIEWSMIKNIDLAHYRGRSCYRKDVQEAEYFLRAKTGIHEISALSFISLKNPDKEHFVIKFISQSDKKPHHVQIKKNKEAFTNYTSCGDDEKSPVPQYGLIEYKEF